MVWTILFWFCFAWAYIVLLFSDWLLLATIVFMVGVFIWFEVPVSVHIDVGRPAIQSADQGIR